MARGDRSNNGDNSGDDQMGLPPEQAENTDGSGRKRSAAGSRRKPASARKAGRKAATARKSTRGVHTRHEGRPFQSGSGKTRRAESRRHGENHPPHSEPFAQAGGPQSRDC